MALSREQSLIWQAMDVGVQWVLRDAVDPLLVSDNPVQTNPARPSAPTVQHVAHSSSVRMESPKGYPQVATKPPRMPAILQLTATAVASLRAESKVQFGVLPDATLMSEVKVADWGRIAELVNRCHACPMAAERINTVVCDGQPGCPVVIVGEAPGRDEDLQGVPFVGKSGQLLTNILSAVGLTRGKDVAICNVLKCRPPHNRDPQPDEVQACSAFLDRQLELLDPKVLVLMGRHAVMRILGRNDPIGRLRGTIHTVELNGRRIAAIVTYHPSYLLRNPVAKEKSWHDLLAVAKCLRQN